MVEIHNIRLRHEFVLVRNKLGGDVWLAIWRLAGTRMKDEPRGDSLRRAD